MESVNIREFHNIRVHVIIQDLYVDWLINQADFIWERGSLFIDCFKT